MLVAALLFGLAAQTPTVTVVAEQPKKERRICKDVDATGSRLGGARECHTASEWKAQQTVLNERDGNELMNTKGYGSGPAGSDSPGIRR